MPCAHGKIRLIQEWPFYEWVESLHKREDDEFEDKKYEQLDKERRKKIKIVWS